MACRTAIVSQTGVSQATEALAFYARKTRTRKRGDERREEGRGVCESDQVKNKLVGLRCEKVYEVERVAAMDEEEEECKKRNGSQEEGEGDDKVIGRRILVVISFGA